MGWNELGATAEIEPSLYAADFSRLGEQIETLLERGRAGLPLRRRRRALRRADHDRPDRPQVDLADRPRLGGVLDCHLMVERPEKHFRQIAEAGGDSVTVHYEVCEDSAGVIRQARELELGVGVAFNPETDPDDVGRGGR